MGWLFRLVFIACMLVPGAALATAGYIHDMTGKGTVVGPTGATTALSVGTIVAAGSTIRTEPNSSAILKFEDGQIAVLAADTDFRVSEYNYNKTKVADSRIAVDLIKGGLRFITGVIGATNRNAVRLTAGTATIGIRGTDLSIMRDAATQAIIAAVNNGEASLNTPLGQALIASGLATLSLPNAPPGVARAVAQMGQDIVAAFGPRAAVMTTLNSTPNIPINTPVVVAASARAAVLQANARANPTDASAQAAAATALNEAIALAQAALTAAIQAGAQTSFPASTPQQIQQLQQQLQQEQSGQTGTGAGAGTSGTGTGSGGAGGGSGLTPASPN
jgi:hypothetical protein